MSRLQSPQPSHPSDGITLFLPAHNEASNLHPLVDEAFKYFEGRGFPFHIIIVDDGSKDDTGAIADWLADEFFDKVSVVHHPINRGYGAALRSGLTASLDTKTPWIAFCDADRQFRINSLDDMIDTAVRQQADMVIGYRQLPAKASDPYQLHKRGRADGLKRQMMGKVWHIVTSALLGFNATDVDCGFKLFSRPLVDDILPYLCGEFAIISPELLARAQARGYRIAEVGVDHYPRQHGEQSGANLRVILGSVRGLWSVRATISAEV